MRPPLAGIVVLVLALPAVSGCLAESDWALAMTGLDRLHQRGLTGKGVSVAVIDTGIDGAHPQFKGLTIVWKDVVNGRSRPYDDSQVGHGTHVAGIVAAQGDLASELANGVRVRGAAPQVSLIIVKAVRGDGDGSDEDVAEAVRFAAAQGADVICMSLGGVSGRNFFGTQTEDAVQAAIRQGVVIVAAAGNKENPNEDNGDVATPASVDGVIAVGAVDKAKRVAPFSYRGDNDGRVAGPLSLSGTDVGPRRDPNKKPEVVAPGVQIVSAARDGRYAIADGTSQATPYVAAAVALLLEAKPGFQREAGGGANAVKEVKAALAEGAEKVGPLAGGGAYAHHDQYGYGLLRADLALARL